MLLKLMSKKHLFSQVPLIACGKAKD